MLGNMMIVCSDRGEHPHFSIYYTEPSVLLTLSHYNSNFCSTTFFKYNLDKSIVLQRCLDCEPSLSTSGTSPTFWGSESFPLHPLTLWRELTHEEQVIATRWWREGVMMGWEVFLPPSLSRGWAFHQHLWCKPGMVGGCWFFQQASGEPGGANGSVSWAPSQQRCWKDLRKKTGFCLLTGKM